MKISIVDNINQCEKLWNQFSTNTRVWDLWKTNFALYNPEDHVLYFIFLESENESGLLPLWCDKHYKKYYFFGGNYPENRNLWIPPKFFPDLWENLPEPTALIDITDESFQAITNSLPEYKDLFIEKDFSYSLDLTIFNGDINEYLKTFSRKHRKNLLYDIRKLLSLGYGVRWENNNDKSEKLIELNKERFLEESDFNDNEVLKDFNAFTKLFSEDGILKTSIVELSDEIIGVEMGFFHEDTYYLLNGGFNPTHKNIGKWMILEHIKKALELGAIKMDFLVGDSSGWKKLWNLSETPVYTLRKGDPSCD